MKRKSPSVAPPSGLAFPKIVPHGRIDKSKLMMATPERVDWAAHRLRVSRHPCIVCWGGILRPARDFVMSQSHHLKFAQPRGRAIKSSDCYVVPLCVAHHDANSAQGVERAGDEAAWWVSHGIDPLPIAAALWTKTSALKPKRKSA